MCTELNIVYIHVLVHQFNNKSIIRNKFQMTLKYSESCLILNKFGLNRGSYTPIRGWKMAIVVFVQFKRHKRSLSNDKNRKQLILLKNKSPIQLKTEQHEHHCLHWTWISAKARNIPLLWGKVANKTNCCLKLNLQQNYFLFK